MSLHTDLLPHVTVEWQSAREIWNRYGIGVVVSAKNVLTVMAEQGKIERQFFPTPSGKIAKFRLKATDG